MASPRNVSSLTATLSSVRPALLHTFMQRCRDDDAGLHSALLQDPVVSTVLSSSVAGASLSLSSANPKSVSMSMSIERRGSESEPLSSLGLSSAIFGGAMLPPLLDPRVDAAAAAPSSQPTRESSQLDTQSLVALVDLATSVQSLELMLVAAHVLLDASVITTSPTGVPPPSASYITLASSVTASLKTLLTRVAGRGAAGGGGSATGASVAGADAASASSLLSPEWILQQFTPDGSSGSGSGSDGGVSTGVAAVGSSGFDAGADTPSVLLVWLLGVLDVVASKYLESHRRPSAAVRASASSSTGPTGSAMPSSTPQTDVAGLVAACVKPAPAESMLVAMAPSATALMLLRLLASRMHSYLSSDGVNGGGGGGGGGGGVSGRSLQQCVVAACVTASSVRVLHAVLHCMVYHGQQQPCAALCDLLPELALSSGGGLLGFTAPGSGVNATPGTGRMSVPSSPRMLPMMTSPATFLMPSASPALHAGAGLPVSLVRGMSTGGAVVAEVLAGVRDALERTFMSAAAAVTACLRAASPSRCDAKHAAKPSAASAADAPTRSARLPGGASRTRRVGGSSDVVASLSDLDVDDGFDDAMSEALPPLASSRDCLDDKREEVSVGAVVVALSWPLCVTERLYAVLALRPAVLQDGAFASLPVSQLRVDGDGGPSEVLFSATLLDATVRAWAAGLRALYSSPAQRHVLLRNALATLIAHCCKVRRAVMLDSFRVLRCISCAPCMCSCIDTAVVCARW
jgi:hypothetical protein